MKARWMVVMIVLLVASSTMGCALYRFGRAEPTKSTKVVLPPPTEVTVYVTMTPTRAPTATPTSSATDTPAPTPTPPPTHTPAPTNTPKATNTPETVEEEAPAAAPAQKAAVPTPTSPPPPTEAPKPMVGQHGTSTLFYLVEPKAEYKNGSDIKVHWQIKNTTPQLMLFGILGINLPTEDSVTGFQSLRSSKYEAIPENGEIGGDVKVRPVRFGNVRGPATLTLTMCFSKLDVCQQPGADWEVIAPPITLEIVP